MWASRAMYTSAEIYNNQHLEDRVSGTDGLCSVLEDRGRNGNCNLSHFIFGEVWPSVEV